VEARQPALGAESDVALTGYLSYATRHPRPQPPIWSLACVIDSADGKGSFWTPRGSCPKISRQAGKELCGWRLGQITSCEPVG
jgi:hypothetical protein